MCVCVMLVCKCERPCPHTRHPSRESSRRRRMLPGTREGAVPHRDRPAHVPWSVGEYKVCIIMVVCASKRVCEPRLGFEDCQVTRYLDTKRHLAVLELLLTTCR